jgi:hypothetical protein
MRRSSAVIVPAASLAAALWLGGGVDIAADELPPSGRYQCAGTSDAAKLTFTVGPGNIYTTTKGFRGTMAIHPGTGNVLFRGAAPQNAFQGRFSPGPPPQVVLLTVADGASNEAGIVCQMR